MGTLQHQVPQILHARRVLLLSSSEMGAMVTERLAEAGKESRT
jgi:hypothetical protein